MPLHCLLLHFERISAVCTWPWGPFLLLLQGSLPLPTRRRKFPYEIPYGDVVKLSPVEV